MTKKISDGTIIAKLFTELALSFSLIYPAINKVIDVKKNTGNNGYVIFVSWSLIYSKFSIDCVDIKVDIPKIKIIIISIAVIDNMIAEISVNLLGTILDLISKKDIYVTIIPTSIPLNIFPKMAMFVNRELLLTTYTKSVKLTCCDL